jgi:cold shock CspA family protein
MNMESKAKFIVTFFDDLKGYEYAMSIDGSLKEEAFIHYSNINDTPFKTLIRGKVVLADIDGLVLKNIQKTSEYIELEDENEDSIADTF